jgi:hypothetical protein
LTAKTTNPTRKMTQNKVFRNDMVVASFQAWDVIVGEGFGSFQYQSVENLSSPVGEDTEP